MSDNAIVGCTTEEDDYQCMPDEVVADFQNGTLTLPSTVTHIGNKDEMVGIGFILDKWFDNIDIFPTTNISMDNVTKIVLPESLTSIKCGFFNRFGNLQEIVFPTKAHITKIFPRAFADCKSLKSLVIPGEYESNAKVEIMFDAFVGCSSIEEIETPANCEMFFYCEDALQGCNKAMKKLNLRGACDLYWKSNTEEG